MNNEQLAKEMLDMCCDYNGEDCGDCYNCEKHGLYNTFAKYIQKLLLEKERETAEEIFAEDGNVDKIGRCLKIIVANKEQVNEI